VAAEAVDLVFHRFLKAFHDEKGNDRSGKADGDADDRYFMNRGRESLLVTPADSFGYEVGEIQNLFTFQSEMFLAK
jgi:hypothetical protein